ncbi:MAG TPA: hypothetical protein VF508_14465, partial [Pyrinomonadaceae bacterium]
PEPLFFRANQEDCITFKHVNLIPNKYRVDDFQVRTPTDIVGQHIHLVKFDVTSSDGAANGWNYEDGTFGDEEVKDRIKHINEGGGLLRLDNRYHRLTPQAHDLFKRPTQVTYQRWLIDNVLELPQGDQSPRDRTLRNAFTHDHFGPSTHQQTGLYAGLVIEPKGSDWLDNELGCKKRLGIGSGKVLPPCKPDENQWPLRDDGGPTSFAALIITDPQKNSYREFLLSLADFQLAYYKDGGIDAGGKPVPDPLRAVNPPGRHEIPLPDQTPPGGPPFGSETRLVERPARQKCPNGDPAPCPEILSADDVGTFVVNYRNEPIPLRVRNPENNTQVRNDDSGDLAHVYRSIPRADPALNGIGPYEQPLTPGVGRHDPFTPLLRAEEGDRVQVRIFVGAHEEGHNFTVHGVKWLFEPFDANSGWRNSQMMGISEKFDFILRGKAPVPGQPTNEQHADYLYQPGAAVDDQWNGLWGILRTYKRRTADGARILKSPQLPEDEPPAPLPTAVQEVQLERARDAQRAKLADARTYVEDAPQPFDGVCPKDEEFAPRRRYKVSAYLARDILRDRRLIFNSGRFNVRNPAGGATGTGPLYDPTAIIYVRDEHIGTNGKYNRTRVEPLILRAAAGECVEVTLTNRLPEPAVDLPGYNTMPMIVD